MKIADGVEMLEITSNIMGQSSMIYPTLIFDEKNVILVDSGFPAQLEKFREAFEKVNLSLNKLNVVILTHHDIDHIGSLASIQKELTRPAKVLTHEQEQA